MKYPLTGTFILLAAVALLSASSCKKEKSSSVQATSKGLLYMRIRSMIDATRVETGDTAIDASGRRIKLNIGQCYISGVTLHKANGSYIILGAYVLQNLDDETYFVDSVATGDYVSISFNVGIDAATNLTKPSSYPARSPLSQQAPTMWFGTPEQGYIFMNIHGLADTTASQTGSVNYPFSYEIGTSAMLKSVILPNKALSIVANQTTFVLLKADYGKALTGINFKTDPEGTPWYSEAQKVIATQVANNIPAMFSYE